MSRSAFKRSYSSCGTLDVSTGTRGSACAFSASGVVFSSEISCSTVFLLILTNLFRTRLMRPCKSPPYECSDAIAEAETACLKAGQYTRRHSSSPDNACALGQSQPLRQNCCHPGVLVRQSAPGPASPGL